MLSLSSLVGSEELVLSGSGVLTNKNVGTGTFSLGSLALGNALGDGSGLASNYTFTGGTELASITARALTISAAGVNRVYDGTTSATVTLSDTRVTNDVLVLTDNSTAASFDTKDVGTGKAVTVTGLRLTGTDKDNYTLSSATAATTANITPYVVSLSGSRIYDGSTTASSSMLSLSSLVGSEELVLSGSGVLTNKNVGTGTFSLGSLALGNALGDGSGLASNYTFTGGTELASITARALTISAAGVNRVYDGTTSATVTLSDTRVTGDSFTDSYTSASFLTKDVGMGKSVMVMGLSFSGSDAGNYALANSTAETTADITVDTKTIVASSNNNSLRDSSVGMTANLIISSPSHSSSEVVSQMAKIPVDSILLVRPVLIPGPAHGHRFSVRDEASNLWPAGN